MKKDFSQQLIESPIEEISLIIQVENELFVLDRGNDYQDTSIDTLPSLELNKNDSAVLTISKFLAEKGLSPLTLRQLVHEQQIRYSFIGNTVGEVKDFRVFLAHVELVQKHTSYDYLQRDQFIERLSKSTFLDDIELAALKFI